MAARRKHRHSRGIHGLAGTPTDHMKDVLKYTKSAKKEANEAIRNANAGRCSKAAHDQANADMSIAIAQYAERWADNKKRAAGLIQDAYIPVENASKAFSRLCVIQKR